MSGYANVTIRTNKDGSRDFYQHDSRRGNLPPRGRGRGRVQQQQQQHRRGGRKGFRDGRPGHPVDGDGDISMGGDDGDSRDRNRFNPYGRPGGSSGGGGGGSWRGQGNRNRGRAGNNRGGRPAQDSRPGDFRSWSKIMIPYGRRLEKNFILKTLTEASALPFIPINFHFDGNAAIFFVEDRAAGAALADLTRQIITPSGQRMTIVVRPSGIPHSSFSKETESDIKECVSRRYNPALGAVDLSYFHDDIVLKAKGLYLPLQRHAIVTQVVSTIQENVTNLVSLNLTGNRLSGLDVFSTLINRVPSLKILLLSDNLLSHLSDLDRIKGILVEELGIRGNPLVKCYKDRVDLVDTLRKRFPKLAVLDGEALPPQIGFDVENVMTLPRSQGSFFVSDEARGVSVQFLEQYFALYDSIDRNPLADAYHENCLFALCSAKTESKASTLAEYMRYSRNLLRVPEPDRRERLIFRGKTEIVSCLIRLPKSLHDPSSFSVDVPLAAPTIMTIATCGVFKELTDRGNEQALRAFSRTFVIVPHGSGFNIVNETLVITNATSEQSKVAFKTPAPTPSPSPVPGAAAVSAVDASPVVAAAAESAQQQLQQQMVAAFSQQSRMTAEWSLKCLQDNNWEFEKAAGVFRELNA